MAARSHALWYSGGARASHKPSSAGGEDRSGCFYHGICNVFAAWQQTARVEEGQQNLASRLRICRGCLRRSVWNERPPTGDLWRDATLVRAAFSRDVAGIFLTGKHYRGGRILAGRALDSCGDALLPIVPACPAAGDMGGPSSNSSPARRRLSAVCLHRAGGDWP